MGNAQYITDAQVDALIVGTQFWRPEGTTLTVCALTLKNKHTVIGESACCVNEKSDTVIGRMHAFQAAREKVFALESYLLKQSLHEGARKQTGFPIPETLRVKSMADSVSDLG